MQRLHLFELEDLPWVPSPLRDGGTDLLDLGFDRMGFYDGVAPQLDALIARTGTAQLLDLCSGGGGGVLQIARRLRAGGRRFELTLTDRYPNEGAAARLAALGDTTTRYRMAPVDAMEGGGAEPGIRTMAGALHHFRPDDVRRLIAGIVAQRRPLAFFDVAASPMVRKLPLALLPLPALINMAMLFVGSLLLTPLVRPVRPLSLLFTYALPLIPVLVAWDGLVSALRAYTPEELLALARSVDGAADYTWDAGVAGKALYLVGHPTTSPA